MWKKIAAFLVLALVGLYLLRAGGILVSPAGKLVREANGGVVLYGTSWCPQCAMARKFFEEQGIAYKEYDTEETEKGRKDFETLNGVGVPVIIAGDKIFHGFFPEKIRAIVKKE